MTGWRERLVLAGTILAYAYTGVLVALVLGIAIYALPGPWRDVLANPEWLHAVWTTAWTSLVATALAGAIGAPIAWVMVHRRPVGYALIDTILDLPMSLSPLVVGLGFLLAFATPPGRFIEDLLNGAGLSLRGTTLGVVVGQTVVATAFAVRHLRAAIERATTPEGGCDWERFRRPLVVAGTITWARTLGEFGPLLLFVGIRPMHNEVLSTSIYLSWQTGDLRGAAAAALTMVVISVVVVVVVRHLAGGGGRR